MEQQKSSRDSLQYSSGYSTQTNTPSCSEDTIPSQGNTLIYTYTPQDFCIRLLFFHLILMKIMGHLKGVTLITFISTVHFYVKNLLSNIVSMNCYQYLYILYFSYKHFDIHDSLSLPGSDYECYSLNGDADSEGQADFDKSSTIPRHSNIAQSYRRMIQTKRPASTAGLPGGKSLQGIPNDVAGSGSGAIASGTATIRRTPSYKTGVRRTPSTSGPIPIRPPIVPVKTPSVPDSPGYASPSPHHACSAEFLYGDDPSAADYMTASPKRMSLPDTTWGCGGGSVQRAVYGQQAPSMAAHGAEEDPLLAANRHSLVEKIGELAASAHALGEGHFPFPSLLPENPALCAPQALSSTTQEDVDMLVSIRRGVKLRKTVTDDRSAPQILR